jgi:hypothetical protein
MTRRPRALREFAPLLAVAAGVLAGVAAAAAEPTLHRSQGSLAPTRGGLPATDARAVAALAGSADVRANVAAALGSSRGGGRAYTVAPSRSGLVVIRDDAGSSVLATRVVQQVQSTVPRMAVSRFPRLRVVTVDAAHDVGRVSPHWAREPLIGAGAGLAVAALLLGARRRPRPGAAALRRRRSVAARPSSEGARWSLDALEARLREADALGRSEREELVGYLGLLSPYAVEGVLPAEFDAVVREAFAPVLRDGP